MTALVLIGLVAAIFGFWQLLFGGSKHRIEHLKNNNAFGETLHSG